MIVEGGVVRGYTQERVMEIPELRRPLFSVTKDDCEWSYTRGTGKGGQKKNKTSSAVHCIHRASGAHGYSEASRSQADNRRDAFMKMSQTREFKNWHKVEIARRTGMLAEVEEAVERQMKNVRVEARVDGRWTEYVEPTAPPPPAP